MNTKAADCGACAGCQWQYNPAGNGWCYMLKQRPDTLPCSQHDKFEPVRKKMTSLVCERPEILAMMIGHISN